VVAGSRRGRGRAAFTASRRVIERIERDYTGRVDPRAYERLKGSLRELTAAEPRLDEQPHTAPAAKQP
jgi:hypothetical protein